MMMVMMMVVMMMMTLKTTTRTTTTNTNTHGGSFSSHLSLPSRLPPLHLRSHARHLAVPAPLARGVVSLQDAILALVRLAEGVAPLLAHALHLADFADRLLELLHAGPVVLDVVLLDLLHVVVGLRPVHALGVLPGEVAQQAEARQHQRHQVEDGRGEEAGDDAGVFGRESQFGRHGRVGCDEGQPDDHRPGDGEEGVFGPDVGDERRFAQHGGQHGRVECGAPDPVPGYLAVGLRQIPVPDEL